MTKNAVAKQFSMYGWGDGTRRSKPESSGSTALGFSSNGDGGGTVQFRFTGAAMPNIVPLTIIRRVRHRQQTGFYTQYFHGRTDGSFTGDGTYHGCHPYPNGGGSGTTHKWEVSAAGGDYVIDDNAYATDVVYDTWFRQASVVQNIASVGQCKYYWDLGAGTDRVITDDLSGVAFSNSSNSPALIFGDAPWNENNERLSGDIRGIIIVQAVLSAAHCSALSAFETDADVIAYCTANSITLWYVNVNPTPTDISDKSGAGHHPAFINANLPTQVDL